MVMWVKILFIFCLVDEWYLEFFVVLLVGGCYDFYVL